MKQLAKIDYIFLFIAIGAFYFFIALYTPFSSGDWSWATQYAKQMVNERFQNLNGRYLAHIFEIGAVRLPYVRALSYALGMMCLIGIMVCYSKMQRPNHLTYILFSFLLILMMPNAIYAQTLGWFAGYYTYIPVTIISLFLLWMMVRIIYIEQPVSKWLICLCYLAAIIGQFFVEHMTLYHSVIVLLGLIAYLWKHKRLNIHLINIWICTLLGTLLMFFNGTYFNVFLGKDAFLKLGDDQGILHKGLVTLIHVIPEQLFFKQYIIITIITLLALCLLHFSQQFRQRGRMVQTLLYVALLLLPVYSWCVYRPLALGEWKAVFWLNVMQLAIALVYFIALLFVIVVTFKCYRTKCLALWLWLSIPLTLLPILFISPVMPQAFFVSYIMYATLALLMLSECAFPPLRVAVLLGFSVFVIATSQIVVFYTIDKANDYRILQLKHTIQIEKHLGQKVKQYQMPKLPFEQRLYQPSPQTQYDKTAFKTYWKIPKSIDLQLIPAKDGAKYRTR